MTRILIVKLSSLGDVFHALPTVASLHKALGAEIHWVVQSEYADLVRTFPMVARVITTSRRHSVRRLPGLWRELREQTYDLVLDLQGLQKSAIVAAMARGQRRIGPSYAREGAHLLYHAVAGKRDLGRHAVEQCLDMVRYLQCDPVAPEPLRFPEARGLRAGPRIALLPVSRWPSKNWPAGHYAALGRLLLERTDVTLYLLGGAAEAGACQWIETMLDPARTVNLVGRQSLVELGGVLQAMDLLIANDSGPVHMAAAAGTRSLALFGPTDPVRTGPYGKGHHVLRAPPPCRPCYDPHCRRFGDACLGRVLPEQVARVAIDMLKSRRNPHGV